MDRLNSVLQSFYKYFRIYPSKWDNLLEDYEKCAVSLANQIEQLQLIQSIPDAKLKILENPMLKENLLGKIYASIEKEVILLNKLVKDSGSLNHEIQEKCGTVRHACKEVDTMPLTGSPTVPAPALLIEWVEDLSLYYQSLFLQLLSPMQLLNYEDPEYVFVLKEAAKEEPNAVKNIKRILAYTQFLAAEHQTCC